MRVDEPMLSMVATRRRVDSRSGASVPKARQAPLNLSLLAMRLRISGVIWMVSVFSITNTTPTYTHFRDTSIRTPIYPRFASVGILRGKTDLFAAEDAANRLLQGDRLARGRNSA